MILADIEQDADRRIERRRKIDLIGRAFDHVGAALRPAARARGSRCRYCRPSARRGRPMRRRCAVSAVVVDLPLVPVMATNGAVGAISARSRQNSSMSPITSTPAARASATDQCGAGCVSGTPGRKHERGDPRPVDLAQIGGRNAGARRLDDGFRVVVPADDVGAAREQRAGARQPRPAEAEDGDFFPGKGGDRDHDGAVPAAGAGRGGRSRTSNVRRTHAALRPARHEVTAASAWRVQRARARPRRSRSGSRSAARSSRAARNGGGSAPCETRACR